MTTCGDMLAAVRECPRDATRRMAYADRLDDDGRHVEAALQRVLAEPDSDAHRLHYADACEAAGDADRAEFVRVQVWKSRIPALRADNAGEGGIEWIRSLVPDMNTPVGQPLHPALVRDRKLLERFGELSLLEEALFGSGSIPWRRLPWGQAPRGAMRRGFIERVETTAALWIAHGDGVLEENPVREVALTTMPSWAHRAGGEVWLYGDVPGADLSAAGGRKLRNVTWDAKGVGGIEKGAAYLAGCLALEWPGVTFTMPPPRLASYWDDVVASVANAR